MTRNGRSERGTEAFTEDPPVQQHKDRLLALYPGLRTTGWAVISSSRRRGDLRPVLAASGVVGLTRSERSRQADRITHQVQALSQIADRWHPADVVLSATGGTIWGAEGLRSLHDALFHWAAERGMSCSIYPAGEIRASLADKPNASRNALAHAAMQRLRLIGERRTAQEWEAIAAGLHHLQVRDLRMAHPTGISHLDHSLTPPRGEAP